MTCNMTHMESHLNFWHFLKTRSWCNGCLNSRYIWHSLEHTGYQLPLNDEKDAKAMQEKNILHSFLQLLQTAVITDTYSLWGNVGFKELAQGSKPCVPRIWVVDSHTVRWQFQIKSLETPQPRFEPTSLELVDKHPRPLRHLATT